MAMSQLSLVLLLGCCIGPARVAAAVNASSTAATPTTVAIGPEGNDTTWTTDHPSTTDVPRNISASPPPSTFSPSSFLSSPAAPPSFSSSPSPSSSETTTHSSSASVDPLAVTTTAAAAAVNVDGDGERSSTPPPSPPSPPPPPTAEPFSYEVFRHRCAGDHLSGIWWNETCGGVIAARRCPAGYVGSAFRMCFYGGDWGQVDASECRLSQLVRLKHLVYYHVHKNLTRGFHALADELLHVLRTFTLHSLDDVLEALDALGIMIDSQAKLDLAQPPDALFVQTLLEITDRLFTRQEAGWAPPHNQQEQVTLMMVQTLHHMNALSAMVADGMRRAGYLAYQVDALPHLGLAARLTQGRQDYVFTRRHGNHSGDRIVVPAETRHVSGEGNQYVFVTLWYRGFHEKLEDPDTIVNSVILASSVHPSRSYRISTPVTVTFRTRQTWESSGYNVECSYLQKTSNRSDLWSNNGCVVVGVKEHQVTCQCHRINNVAVILKRIARIPQKLRPEAVNTVILVGCFLSLVALIATFVAHAHLLLRSDAADSTLILFHIIIAMASTQIVFMAGIQATDKRQVCGGVSIALHYLHLVTSFWLLAHGINVYLRLRRGPDALPPVPRHMRDYCLLAWIVPAILVVLTFIVNPRGYETRRYCWLSIERGMLLSFIVPVSSLIMINTTLMVLALKHFFELRAITRKTDIDRIRIAMRLGIVTLPLFGVNWFLGVLALEDTSTYVFEVAFAFTNSLQGFLIFFFNCVLNSEIRHGLWRRCCCFRRKQRKSLDLRLRRSRKRHRRVDAEPLLVKVDEGVTPLTLAPPMPASVSVAVAVPAKPPCSDGHVAT